MDLRIKVFHKFNICVILLGFVTVAADITMTNVTDASIDGVISQNSNDISANSKCIVQTDDARDQDVIMHNNTGMSIDYLYTSETTDLLGYFNVYTTCFDSEKFVAKKESVTVNKILELIHSSYNSSYHPWSEVISLSIIPAESTTKEQNVTCTFNHGLKTVEVFGDVDLDSNISHNINFEESGIKQGNFVLTVNCTFSSTSKYQILKKNFFVYYDFLKADFFDEVYKTPLHAQTAKTNQNKMVTASLPLSKILSSRIQTEWRVYDENEDIVKVDLPDNSQASKMLPANSMKEGTYRIELEVNVTVIDEIVSTSDFIYLNYTFPDILPEITVNNVKNYVRKISLNAEKDNNLIVISTEDTRDPAEDLANFNLSPKIMKMSCETSDIWTEEDVLKILDTENIIGNTSSCSNLIPSDVNRFSITKEDLVTNQWYMLKLTVSRAERESSIFQAILVTDKKIPALYIQSVANSYKTPTNFEKITLTDLQVNMFVDVDELELRYMSYYWKFETLVKSSTADLVATGIDPGFKVSKAQLEQWPSRKYRLSCRVKSPNFYEVITYKFYVMNQAPYGGNCTLQVKDDPVVTGETKVCIDCFDWVDEGTNFERNIDIDHGGSLLYAPVQTFLTADREVNISINEQMHTPLAILHRCFTVMRPPNNESNFTRIDVRIYDEWEAPYTTVMFDDIKIQYHSTGSEETGAESVNALFSSHRNVIYNAVQLHDVISLTETVQTITSELHIEIPDETPLMPFTDFDADTGGLTDILPNGTAVSLSEVISDLEEQTIVPLVKAIRDANDIFVDDIHLLVMNETKELSLIEVLQLAKTTLKITSINEIYFNDKTLVSLVQVTKYVFGVTETVTYETPLKEDLVTTCIALVNSLVVPDTLPSMEVDASLKTQRQRNAELFKFASDDTIQTMEEKALMFDEERSWFFSQQLSIVKYTIDKRRNLVTELSEMIINLYDSLVENSKVSFGAEVVIGNNISFAKMVTETTERLVEKSISSTTTLVSFEDFVPSPNAILNIGLMETYSVVNIDNIGSASKITSNQKRLIIESKDDRIIPHTVIFMHQVSKVVPKTHVPIVHTDDASKMDYHIVQVSKADDDLFVNVEPIPGMDATYIVYILFTNEDRHVSKKEYTAMTYSTKPNYIAHFTSAVMGSHTGVWQIGIKTLLQNTNWSDIDGTDIQSLNGSYIDYPPFKLATVTAGCMTWNDASNSWGTKDCQGTWKKTTNELQCKCKASKRTTFASSFRVAPNKIDYKTVFLKFSPLSQAAVMGVLFVIFLTYFIVLAWATHRDKTDILKWGITALEDNIADDNYFYVIKVFTGMRPKSGTKSRVSIVIGGEETGTGVRQLYDGVRKEFPTGSVLQFLMCTPRYLGDLVFIRIWHDNSGIGRHASWYLSKIEVEDIQRNEKFTFLAERWLSDDEADNRLDCVIPVCKNENVNKFKYRVINNAKENIAEGHAWLSVVYRPQTSNFTRKQRASCTLMFIMLTLISNAMFFQGSNEDNYELPTDFEVGPFRFSFQQAYLSLISVLVVTPTTMLVVYLFKLSRYYHENRNKPIFNKPRRKKNSRDLRIPFLDSWLDKEQDWNTQLERRIIQKGYPDMQGFTLPSQCVYFAWVLSILATLVSAFYVVLYSMDWGKQKSEEWVTMLLLSIFQSIFCVDPLKILLMAVIFAVPFRKMSSPKTTITRRQVIKYFSASPRKKIGARMSATTVDTVQLKEARMKHAKAKKSVIRIYDCISSAVLIWILVSISNSSRDSNSYKLYQNIENTLVKPSSPASFSKIQTTEDFYRWLNDTAIMKSFPEVNIGNGRTLLHWRERQYIEGGYLLRVGPPRLRQLRINKGRCRYSYIGTTDCYENYRSKSEDSGSYCFRWINEKCSQKETLYNYSSPAWRYTSSLDIWGLPTVGHFATYSGGGYIAKLSVNRLVSQKIINELYRNIWIDRKTRAVFFEFTLYSPNTNIFIYCIFMVEFPETGGAVPTYSIFPLRVYLHHGPSGMYTMTCEIAFIFYLLLCTFNVAIKLLKEKKTFFKDSWQIFDLCFVIGGYIAIAMVIVQMEFAHKSLDVFREDKREFINFQHIAVWNQIVVLSIGILVFMAILRLLKIFGYTQRIKVLANVFSKASKDLISFSVFFTFTFISYAALGYLLFGSNIKAYKNVVKAMETLFISILGKSRFAEVEETDPVMAKVYFLLFVSGVVYLMMTIFFSILCAAIDEAHKICLKDNESEFVTNIINTLRRFIGLGNKVSLTAVTPNEMNQESKEVSPHIKTDDYSDARKVLTDIRSYICEAMMVSQRDFTTPLGGKGMKKVRFRR